MNGGCDCGDISCPSCGTAQGTLVQCPDGGHCHHDCARDFCWRVRNAGPLSGVFDGDVWPPDVVALHTGRVQPDGDPLGGDPRPEPSPADVRRVFDALPSVQVVRKVDRDVARFVVDTVKSAAVDLGFKAHNIGLSEGVDGTLNVTVELSARALAHAALLSQTVILRLEALHGIRRPVRVLCGKRQPLPATWPGKAPLVTDTRERIVQLARSFPCLQDAAGLSPWDAAAFSAWALQHFMGGSARSGTGDAAGFILAVWWGCAQVQAPFDAVTAMRSWDAEHRAAFAAWAAAPWWA